MNLQKKIAIVTGASSGIGAAFCKKLIEKGATVYGLARRAEKLEEIRRSLGSSFLPVVMDIGNQAEIAGWVEKEFTRSEERRVGKEGRYWLLAKAEIKKNKKTRRKCKA